MKFSKKYFLCSVCGKKVPYKAPGTKNRNHCPFCLWSLHVDNKPGDRSSGCKGLMQPVGKIIKDDGEEVIVHKCTKCGDIRKNRVAGDDSFKEVENLKIMDFF